jgi:hypothetical protein
MEGNSYDYLEDEVLSGVDTAVLSNLSVMAEKLSALKDARDRAEEALKKAAAAYDEYRLQVLPTAMLSAGVQEVTTPDGKRIAVKNKYYCNPNKNEADRLRIGQWLYSHGAGDLIKQTAVVDGEQLARLSANKIPYVEKWDMNTNSLKAWIKDQLGVNGGVASLSMDEIPDCVHFVQVDEVEISA